MPHLSRQSYRASAKSLKLQKVLPNHNFNIVNTSNAQTKLFHWKYIRYFMANMATGKHNFTTNPKIHFKILRHSLLYFYLALLSSFCASVKTLIRKRSKGWTLPSLAYGYFGLFRGQLCLWPLRDKHWRPQWIKRIISNGIHALSDFHFWVNVVNTLRFVFWCLIIFR